MAQHARFLWPFGAEIIICPLRNHFRLSSYLVISCCNGILINGKKPLVLGVPLVRCYMHPLFLLVQINIRVRVAWRPLSRTIPYLVLEIDEFAHSLAMAPIALMFVCSRKELNIASCASRQQKQPFLLFFHQTDACGYNA